MSEAVEMLVYVATKNVGKLRELTEIFSRAAWQLATFAAYCDVVEGDESYAANAALKARALRSQLSQAGIAGCVLGDDSGLEVEALGGGPGVRSARYCGETASWAERRASLLAEVAREGVRTRNARFVCALHFIAVDGRETAVVARYDGAIAEFERGERGFSYDSIFESVLHERRTFAELDSHEKNRISHRARAAAALLDALSAGPESAEGKGNTGASGT